MIGRSWRSVAPPAVAVAAVLGLGVYPAHRSNADATSRAESAQTQLAELTVRATALTALADDGAELETQLVALDRLVPAEHDIAGFIVELDGIAGSLDLQLRDVVPLQTEGRDGDPGTPPGWTSVGVQVRIVGSYLDLIEFAEATTRTERLSVIDSMRISASSFGELDAVISMRLFRNDDPTDGLLARYVESRGDVAEDEESQP